MKTHSLHRQAGLNLIEILVAALILSIGLLSLAGLQVASLKSTMNATQKQQASYMIHELLERMRSNRAAALNENYNGQFDLAVTCSGAAPIICDDTVSCDPAQMAQYDLYTMQCGSNAAGAVDSGINDQLYRGQLSVQCANGTSAPSCTDITIDLQWTERLSMEGVQGDDGSGNTVEIEQQDVNLVVNATI